LEVLCKKFTHTRFEPSGFTNNPNIPIAKSVTDYIFRWLAMKFLSKEEQRKYISEEFIQENNLINQRENENAVPPPIDSDVKPPIDKASVQKKTTIERQEQYVFETQADAPNCPECGSIMVRNGSCYKCLECGFYLKGHGSTGPPGRRIGGHGLTMRV